MTSNQLDQLGLHRTARKAQERRNDQLARSVFYSSLLLLAVSVLAVIAGSHA